MSHHTHTPYDFDLLMVDRTASATPPSAGTSSFPGVFPRHLSSLALDATQGCSPVSNHSQMTPMSSIAGMSTTSYQSVEPSNGVFGCGVYSAPPPPPALPAYATALMYVPQQHQQHQQGRSIHCPPPTAAVKKARKTRRVDPQPFHHHQQQQCAVVEAAAAAAPIAPILPSVHDRIAAVATRYISTEIAHCDYTAPGVTAESAAQLCSYEDGLFRQAPTEMLGFFATEVPAVAIETYVSKIVAQANCSASCLLIALSLMKRLALLKGYDCPVTPRSLHRLFLVCFVLAIKSHEENFHSLAYYASLGGVTQTELRALERILFVMLDFNCFVDAEEYRQTLYTLRRMENPAEVEGCSAASLPKEVSWDILLPAMV